MVPNGRIDKVSHELDQRLSRLSPIPYERCIFKVHDQLRKISEKAYDPDVIAIGPYHRGKDRLQIMEEHKLRYLQSLVQRRKTGVQTYVAAIRELEEQARKCYAEHVTLDKDEFVEMLLLDGCFIIELFRKYSFPILIDDTDPIFRMPWIRNSLMRDLMLFENQMPYFILKKLFDMTEVSNQQQNFNVMAMQFFKEILPFPVYGPHTRNANPNNEIKHLIGLIHSSCLPPFAKKGPNKDDMTFKGFIRRSTELKEMGVKFKRADKGSLFDMKFSNGVMEIPPFTVDDYTESSFRNLIAYEQYSRHNHRNYVTDYMKFMDCLIDSPKDVELLRRRGIITNCLGDDEVVSTMFNKLGENVTIFSDVFSYSEIFNEVNTHCSKLWNLQMAGLRHNYFNTPWASISFLAGVILLLLTVTQTIFTIYPNVKKNRSP